MQKKIIIFLIAAALVHAVVRSLNRSRPTWWQHLQGRQKLLGVVALAAAIVIVLNPDLLALGLLGDTDFFDMLVLALGVSMNVYAHRAGQSLAFLLGRAVRRLGIPSPGLRYGLGFSMGIAGEAIQRTMPPSITLFCGASEGPRVRSRSRESISRIFILGG